MSTEFDRRLEGRSPAYKAAMIEVARAVLEFAQADASEKDVAGSAVGIALDDLQKVIDQENN